MLHMHHCNNAGLQQRVHGSGPSRAFSNGQSASDLPPGFGADAAQEQPVQSPSSFAAPSVPALSLSEAQQPGRRPQQQKAVTPAPAQGPLQAVPQQRVSQESDRPPGFSIMPGGSVPQPPLGHASVQASSSRPSSHSWVGDPMVPHCTRQHPKAHQHSKRAWQ